MKRKTVAQSVLEYAVFLGMIVVAFVVMRVYLQRGIQGKIKDMAKEISDTQYAPENENSSYVILQQQRIETKSKGYEVERDEDIVMERRGSGTTTLDFDSITEVE